jgi:hypothetical protein
MKNETSNRHIFHTTAINATTRVAAVLNDIWQRFSFNVKRFVKIRSPGKLVWLSLLCGTYMEVVGHDLLNLLVCEVKSKNCLTILFPFPSKFVFRFLYKFSFGLCFRAVQYSSYVFSDLQVSAPTSISFSFVLHFHFIQISSYILCPSKSGLCLRVLQVSSFVSKDVTSCSVFPLEDVNILTHLFIPHLGSKHC